MPPAIRILIEVVTYRIRKHEMVNLASTLTMMLALGLETKQIATRILFAISLNLHVYLVNDLFDISHDMQGASDKAQKAVYLSQYQRAGWRLALIIAVITISAGALFSVSVVICWLGSALAGLAYSGWMKRMAGLDLLAIMTCAMCGSLLAFPLECAVGWQLTALLGLFAMCFQIAQMRRDRDHDAQCAVRTTAVVLSAKLLTGLQRTLLVGCAVYTWLIVHRWIGLAMVAIAFSPRLSKCNEPNWTHLRMMLGSAWMAIIIWIIITHRTYGWLLTMDRNTLW